MTDLVFGVAARLLEWILRIFRLPGLRSPRIYGVWAAPALQPAIERLARARALAVYRKARKTCPAYRAFLEVEGDPAMRGGRDFSRIPATTKENYVRRFSIESRCHGGRIPSSGVVIDESSGSSGTPNNWVRGNAERASTRRLLHHSYRLRFGDRSLMFLNCFALGPWATGMNVSMSIADVAILKSIGPDKTKLENTLSLFGPSYGYVLAGYPPFIKDWLDTTALDLAPYDLHLITGGEGCSEGLRAFFEKTFGTVVSSYGASDLEINLAAETDFTIALRRACSDDPGLCAELFGREQPPMIFQYNAFDYLVESTGEDELVISVLRRQTVAPKIRYNIRDLGGALTFRDVMSRLERHGTDLDLGPGRVPAFPLMYVFGRNDLSVPFYGAKVFTSDVEAILNGTPAIEGRFSSFRLSVQEDESLDRRLVIRLERAPYVPAGSSSGTASSASAEDGPRDTSGADETLTGLFYSRLRDVNQDFREVSKLFGPEAIEVAVLDHGDGPFATRDRRVKERYVDAAG